MSQANANDEIRRHLFYDTSHSPSLIDLVGYDNAKDIIDFCFIANPYYPTPDMLSQLQSMLPTLIKSYPSSIPDLSNKFLAEVLHVDPRHLIIGNGATELITRIEQDLIKNIAIPVPTFSEYLEKLESRHAAKLYSLSPQSDYALDLDAFLKWIEEKKLDTALIINPGNPTGQLLPLEHMLRFLRDAQDLELVIVDESFIDFSGNDIPTLLPYTGQHPNLLIVRSMSKHCGIPGLRLGYCYTKNTHILDYLRSRVPAWNINTLAEYFLSLLPSTEKQYHESRRQVIEDVRWLQNALEKVPLLKVYPTGANFVLIRIDNGMTAKELQETLLHKYKMYVRDCSNKVGMDNYHIRIASQGKEKDPLLIKALSKISTDALL